MFWSRISHFTWLFTAKYWTSNYYCKCRRQFKFYSLFPPPRGQLPWCYVEGDAYVTFIYPLVVGKTVRCQGNVKCFCYEAYSHVVHSAKSLGSLLLPYPHPLSSLYCLPVSHLPTCARHLSPGPPMFAITVLPDVFSLESIPVSYFVQKPSGPHLLVSPFPQ